MQPQGAALAPRPWAHKGSLPGRILPNRQSLAPLLPRLQPQPRPLQGPGTGTCGEAQNGIPRNGEYCKLLQSALSLNFAFNICSPINLCLLPVNCARARGSNLHPSALSPQQHGPGGPSASLGHHPRAKGRAKDPPRATPAPPAPSGRGSPGPVTTGPARFCQKPSTQQTFNGLFFLLF